MGSKGFANGGSKYEGYDNKGKTKATNSYNNSDYNSGYSGNGLSGGSNLNKYKKDLGGNSAYKKEVGDKKK